MSTSNIFYAQSGGVTAVINATASGVIEQARAEGRVVLAGRNGILGGLREELIDTSRLSSETVAALKYTPGGAFGSCRYKLKDVQQQQQEYERLLQVFEAHGIGIFLYNGGGDSQDTAHKLAHYAQSVGFPLQCIGIPKTIDNDLYGTDNSPGYGSVAKYAAISAMEAGLDVASMCNSSTKVFILEVMGRHTGWIAAAAGIAALPGRHHPPHILVLPEVVFAEEAFCARVHADVQHYGYCVVVTAEGARDHQGLLATSDKIDAFGHHQLGGVAPKLAAMIQKSHGYKCHFAVADYLQRSARHIASQTDVDQAYALGQKAVELALEGKSGVMPGIVRIQSDPYEWRIQAVPLADVANTEKPLPSTFISSDGLHVTEEFGAYVRPLIAGEAYPPYQQGLPQYLLPDHELLPAKLPIWRST